MSKSNKELAVEVAIAAINNNPKMAYGINNTHLSAGLPISSICSIIKSVNATLEEIDNPDSK